MLQLQYTATTATLLQLRNVNLTVVLKTSKLFLYHKNYHFYNFEYVDLFKTLHFR